jgi:hypothetical protein
MPKPSPQPGSSEPVDTDDMNPVKKPKREQGLDPSEQARQPGTEPPKEKRIDDL